MRNHSLYRFRIFMNLIIIVNIFSTACAAPLYFNQYHRKIEVKSWKFLRDNNIIKQNIDYSCGGRIYSNNSEWLL